MKLTKTFDPEKLKQKEDWENSIREDANRNIIQALFSGNFHVTKGTPEYDIVMANIPKHIDSMQSAIAYLCSGEADKPFMKWERTSP